LIRRFVIAENEIFQQLPAGVRTFPHDPGLVETWQSCIVDAWLLVKEGWVSEDKYDFFR